MLIDDVANGLTKLVSRRGFFGKLARAAASLGAVLILRTPALAGIPISCCTLCKQPDGHGPCGSCT